MKPRPATMRVFYGSKKMDPLTMSLGRQNRAAKMMGMTRDEWIEHIKKQNSAPDPVEVVEVVEDEASGEDE